MINGGAVFEVGTVSPKVQVNAERKDIPVGGRMSFLCSGYAVIGHQELQVIHRSAGLDRIAGKKDPPPLPIEPISGMNEAVPG